MVRTSDINGKWCPCCGAVEAIELEIKRYHQCSNCLHIWIDTSDVLDKNYYENLTERNPPEYEWSVDKYNERSGFLDLFITDKTQRVLEVGCAEGALGAKLKSNKSVLYHGVELSKDRFSAAKHLDKVFDVISGEIVEEPYDLILSFHVLEHVHDVVSEILSWKKLLKDDGLIVFEVPNLSGHEWVEIDQNKEHIHQFSILSVIHLLKCTDLECVQLSTGHFESPLYNDSIRVVAKKHKTQEKRREELLHNIGLKLGEGFYIYGVGGDFRSYVLPVLSDVNV